MIRQVKLEDAIKEIRSRNKPYIGVMPQSTFSVTLCNIENGRAKRSTVREFMARFGYKDMALTFSFEDGLKKVAGVMPQHIIDDTLHILRSGNDFNNDDVPFVSYIKLEDK